MQLFLQIVNVANAISALTGKQHLDDVSADYLDDDKNLVNAFEAKEHYIADNIITKELAISFIFRRMLKAESLVRQYFEVRLILKPVVLTYRVADLTPSVTSFA